MRNVTLAATIALVIQACVATTNIVTSEAGMSTQAAGGSPMIHSFSATPSNTARPGQAITFQVVATDPTGASLQFNWAATGGTLSTTTGQLVAWTPPEAPGTYMVQVLVTNGRGGAVSGSQSLVVKPEGIEIPTPAIVTPPPSPALSASPASSTDVGAVLSLDGYTFQSLARGAKDNGDDALQRGESVVLQPRIKNVGTSKTDGVKVQLTTQDPYADVQSIVQNPTASDSLGVDGIHYYSIGPGESRGPYFRESGGFLVAISPQIPAKHALTFDANIHDRYGNTWNAHLTITIP